MADGGGFNALKAVLNVMTILISGFSKIPQIRTSWIAKSTEGTSVAALTTDLISYTISVRYFLINGYPYFDFFEYYLIMLQMFALVVMSQLFSKRLGIKDIILSSVAVGVLAFSFAPRWITFPGPFVMGRLLNMSTPLSVFGKMMYIRAIVTSKRGDLIARIPWFLNGTSSLFRIITVTMEKPDINILIGLVLSVILNYVIIGVAIAYTPKNPLQEDGQDEEEKCPSPTSSPSSSSATKKSGWW